MRFRSLPNSDVIVSEWGVSLLPPADHAHRDQFCLERLFRQSVDRGVTFFDLRAVDASGLADDAFLHALNAERGRLVIGAGARADGTPAELAASLSLSLERTRQGLNLDCIDVLFLDFPLQGEVDPVRERLRMWRDAGVVRTVCHTSLPFRGGTDSAHPLFEMDAALFCAGTAVPPASDRGVVVSNWNVSDERSGLFKRIQVACDGMGRGFFEAASLWCLRQPRVMSVVGKISTDEEGETVAAAAAARALTDSELAALDAAAAAKPFAAAVS